MTKRTFVHGDMAGKLPGTGRRWEIEETGRRRCPFTVWYAGVEHGGDFKTYEDAIASIRPTEEGD